MGIGGTIEGYTALKGMRYETFTDFPDIVLRGRGNFEPYYHGTANYNAADGTKLVILFPAYVKDWNGKIYFIAHIAGNYSQIGTVKPAGDAYKLNPGLGVYFPSLMVDKGYAILFSSRSSSNQTGVGPSTVTLDDGTVLGHKAFGMHAGLFHDLTMVGKRYIEMRLDGKPGERIFTVNLKAVIWEEGSTMLQVQILTIKIHHKRYLTDSYTILPAVAFSSQLCIKTERISCSAPQKTGKTLFRRLMY
jgi:hypothetical protein